MPVAPGHESQRTEAAAPSFGRLVERLLYQDKNLLILDKPAGIPVHKGPGGGPNLEDFLPSLSLGLPRAPALAHRLDRDTSGCLVLGRHHKALARLGRLFAGGKVEKRYWAIVDGRPPEASGRIDLALRKATERRDRWWMEGHPDGQPAATDYRVLAATGTAAWLELRPLTGRTHQVRVHCAALGCPVRGDPTYGAGIGPLLLHARAISLPYYAERPPVTAAAPPPPSLMAWFQANGITPDDGNLESP